MKQIKLVASLIVSASILSPSAYAHVLPNSETRSVITEDNYNWTGIYAGLNAGAVRNTMSVTDNQAVTFNATIQQVLNPTFTGGFQVGYRHQLVPSKTSGLFGLDFSMDFSNAKFQNLYGSPFALYQLVSVNKLRNLPMLQVIGGIAADRTLLFFAAGLSWADISGNITNTDGIPFFNSFNVGQKAIGTAFGGGIEYAFTDTLSARFKVDVVTTNAYTTFDNTNNSYQVSNSIVQSTVGLNYNFG